MVGLPLTGDTQVLEEKQSKSGQCSPLASQTKCCLVFDVSQSTCLWAQRTALWEWGKLPFFQAACRMLSKRTAMPHRWSEIYTGTVGAGWLQVHHFNSQV